MASIRGQKTRHANRCRIVVGGETLAEGTNVTANESGGTQGVYTVGQHHAHEHVHGQHQARVSIGKLVWKGSALRRLNIGNDLSKLDPVDIQAFDEVDGDVLFVARDCTLADRSMTISSNQPINSNVSFQAIRLEDNAAASGAPSMGLNPGNANA